MEMPQVISLGQLTVPSMGTITINDDDILAIARSYLDVLEKKFKEKKPGITPADLGEEDQESIASMIKVQVASNDSGEQ